MSTRPNKSEEAVRIDKIAVPVRFNMTRPPFRNLNGHGEISALRGNRRAFYWFADRLKCEDRDDGSFLGR